MTDVAEARELWGGLRPLGLTVHWGELSVPWRFLAGATVSGHRVIREPCGENNGGAPQQRLVWECA